jgi:hypothetical protein
MDAYRIGTIGRTTSSGRVIVGTWAAQPSGSLSGLAPTAALDWLTTAVAP